MVNLGNFFGARGRAVDPNSDRQLAMACKAQGLVFDKDTKQCRAPLPRGRGPGAGPSVASLRAACKAQGLVLDMDSKQCRASKRGNAMTVAQMREMCKAAGKVLDKNNKQCRDPLPKGRKSGLEAAYARGSLFFGVRGRPVDPMSARQLAMDCKAQGLVFDKNTKQCRESRRRRDPTQKEMTAMCKAQGLVFDRATKQCRAALPKGRKSGKNKFGVTRPFSDQRPGVVYHSPASKLGSRNVYDIMGPVKGPITGPESFILASSVLSPDLYKELGIPIPKKIPDKPSKKILPGVPTPQKFLPGVPTPKSYLGYEGTFPVW